MEDGVIEMSDLIHDDGGIDKIIEKIGELDSAFRRLTEDVKLSASGLSAELRAVKSDTEAGRKKIYEAKAAAEALSEAESRLASSRSEVGKMTAYLSSASSEASRAVRTNAKDIEALSGRLGEIRARMSDAGMSASEVSRAMKSIDSAIRNAKASVEAFNPELSALANSAKSLETAQRKLAEAQGAMAYTIESLKVRTKELADVTKLKASADELQKGTVEQLNASIKYHEKLLSSSVTAKGMDQKSTEKLVATLESERAQLNALTGAQERAAAVAELTAIRRKEEKSGANGLSLSLDELKRKQEALMTLFKSGAGSGAGYENLAREIAETDERIKRLTADERVRLAQEDLAIIKRKEEDAAARGVSLSMQDLIRKQTALTAITRSGTKETIEDYETLKKELSAVSGLLNRMYIEEGNYKRNVGNYPGRMSNLTFQTSQLLRELPNATMGLRMVALALSNNLPIFWDAVRQQQDAIKEAEKNGVKGMSIWKEIGKAIFSFQSVLILGVSLLITYSDSISKFFKGLFSGAGEFETFVEAYESINDRVEKSTSKSLGATLGLYEKLRREWISLDDEKERTAWVRKHAEDWKKLDVEINNVNDADNVFVTGSAAFVDALAARSIAMAANELATEKYGEAIKKISEAQTKEIEKDKALSSGSVPWTTRFNTDTRRRDWEKDMAAGTEYEGAMKSVNDRLAVLYRKRNTGTADASDKKDIAELEAERKRIQAAVAPGFYKKFLDNGVITKEAYDEIIGSYGSGGSLSFSAIRAMDAVTGVIADQASRQREIDELKKEASDLMKSAEQYTLIGDTMKSDKEKTLKDLGINPNPGKDDRKERAGKTDWSGKLKSESERVEERLSKSVEEASPSKTIEERYEKELKKIEAEYTKGMNDLSESERKLSEIGSKGAKKLTEAELGSMDGLRAKIDETRRNLERKRDTERAAAAAKRDSELAKEKKRLVELDLKTKKKGSDEYNALEDELIGLNYAERRASASGDEERRILDRLEEQERAKVASERAKVASERAKHGAEKGLKALQDTNKAKLVEWDPLGVRTSRERERKKDEMSRSELQYRVDNGKALGLTDEEIRYLTAQIAQIDEREKNRSGMKGFVSDLRDEGLFKTALGRIKFKKTGPDGESEELPMFSEKALSAMSTAKDKIIGNLNEIMDAEVKLREQEVKDAQKRTEEAKKSYDAEIEARRAGYASDVETAEKELKLAQENEDAKRKMLQKSQKAQAAVDAASQASSLATATAGLIASYSKSGPLAIGLITAAIAAMWTTFAVAKVKAAQVARQTSKYGKGGYEVISGGSHVMGNDVPLGLTTSRNTGMVAEGGEGVAVISRRAVSKYGKSVGAVVDAINDMSFPKAYANGLAESSVAMSLNVAGRTDLTRVESGINALIGQGRRREYVLPDGAVVHETGTHKRIVRS